VGLAAAAGLWGLLQWPVTERQGINYEVYERTLPLYVKLARFLSRDLEYRHLARTLTRGIHDDEAKVVRLAEWVRAHVVAGTPAGLRVVDDHVWHIIVRGYGEPDQLADVLATLCAYAGVPAELAMLYPPGESQPIHAVALVKLAGRWCPVDPHRGIIVRNAAGRIASREELLADPTLARTAAPGVRIRGIDYARLLTWLPDVSTQRELRPYRQMPLWRAWYALRRAGQARGAAAPSS
jgi:hypothetical protein